MHSVVEVHKWTVTRLVVSCFREMKMEQPPKGTEDGAKRPGKVRDDFTQHGNLELI